jgi:hypothetical protein
MGVDDIENATNKSRVNELNGYLLNQIGEDIMQFDAMVDDYKDIDLNMNTRFYAWQYVSQATPEKASMLMANFDPQLLRQEAEQTNERVGDLLARFNPAFIKGQNGIAKA